MSTAPKQTIDPIYKRYATRVIKNIASTEFYDFFMSVVRTGKNVFQFSNRRVEKSVDERWVKAIEDVIKPMQEIINNPRNFIKQDEVIVNIALVKKVEPDSIRHLAMHGDMIDNVTEDSVRPNKMMEKFKEDTWNTYENKFVYTLLEMSREFVNKRYDTIFAALNDEYGAHLLMQSDSSSLQEHLQFNLDIKIQQEEDLLTSDVKNESIFSRIARLHRILGNFASSPFAKEMKKYGKIRPPLVRTNAIAKNPNFKACHKLWNFILSYNDIGYKITVVDQAPDIDTQFETDIFNSLLFDYIILKNHLEAKDDRAIDTAKSYKKKTLKPQFIKEVIEEITKDYDLKDVEIKKVLIEEMTKAQLMQEEEAERRRLVEEKEKEMREKARLEELERKRREKEEEKERLRLEKDRERENARLEKERQFELERQVKEKLRIEKEESALTDAFKAEIYKMYRDRETLVDKRQKQAELDAKRREEEAAREAALEEKRKKQEALEEKRRKSAAEKQEKEEKARKKAEEAEKLLNPPAEEIIPEPIPEEPAPEAAAPVEEAPVTAEDTATEQEQPEVRQKRKYTKRKTAEATSGESSEAPTEQPSAEGEQPEVRQKRKYTKRKTAEAASDEGAEAPAEPVAEPAESTEITEETAPVVIEEPSVEPAPIVEEAVTPTVTESVPETEEKAEPIAEPAPEEQAPAEIQETEPITEPETTAEPAETAEETGDEDDASDEAEDEKADETVTEKKNKQSGSRKKKKAAQLQERRRTEAEAEKMKQLHEEALAESEAKARQERIESAAAEPLPTEKAEESNQSDDKPRGLKRLFAGFRKK